MRSQLEGTDIQQFYGHWEHAAEMLGSTHVLDGRKHRLLLKRNKHRRLYFFDLPQTTRLVKST